MNGKYYPEYLTGFSLHLHDVCPADQQSLDVLLSHLQLNATPAYTREQKRRFLKETRELLRTF